MFGQEFNYYSFNDLYDFEQTIIFDIQQDSNQNMWFGGGDGLVKFDGKNFTTYTHPDYSPSFTNIKFDTLGRVWCSNFSGQLFYVENDSFYLAADFSDKKNFINDYYPYGDHAFVVTNDFKELIKFNLKNKIRSPVGDQEHVKYTHFSGDSLYFFERHNIQDSSFIIRKSLHLQGNNEVKTVASINIPLSSKKTFYTFKNGIEYLSVTRNSLKMYTYNSRKKSLEFLFDNPLFNAYNFNSFQYLDNEIWVFTKKGLTRLSKKGDIIASHLYPDHNISSSLKDHEGNIWLSTLNNGIFIIPTKKISSYKISEAEVQHATFDTFNNLYYCDNKGYIYMSQAPYKKFTKINETQLDPTPMLYNPSKDIIYLGYLEGLYLNLSDLKIVNSKKKLSSFRKGMILNPTTSVINKYSNTSIFNLNEKEDIDFPYILEKNQEVRNSNFEIRKARSSHALTSPDETHLYISYTDGLMMYSKDEKPKKVMWNSAPINTINMISDDEEGIWSINSSRKLIKIVEDEVVWETDIPSPSYQLTQWKDYIFLGAQKGVYKVHIPTKEIELINETDGLYKCRIIDLFIYQDTLNVVGGKYLQKFPCNYTFINKTPPSLSITKVILNDKKIPLKKEYNLEPKENGLTFFFNTKSYRSQKQITYQYRLNNSTSDWLTTTYDAPFARFSKLAPGEYIFEVKACNEDGICSDSEKIYFFIDYPYTQKWWFYLIFLLAGALIIFIVLRLRYKINNKQNKLISEQQSLRKEVYKSKIAAIRSQMNPHFMFNALNTIQEFIVTNQQEVASEYLADFADLMRKYLNQSRKDIIELHEEIETLDIYLKLENLRFDGHLNYEIKTNLSPGSSDIRIPVMLIQPFVENSIKHGLLHKKGEKKLLIEFSTDNSAVLKCIIEDNGVGRKASALINKGRSIQHKSFSTGANDKRLEIINQNLDREIKVDIIDLEEEGKPSGTRVVITIK